MQRLARKHEWVEILPSKGLGKRSLMSSLPVLSRLQSKGTSSTQRKQVTYPSSLFPWDHIAQSNQQGEAGTTHPPSYLSAKIQQSIWNVSNHLVLENIQNAGSKRELACDLPETNMKNTVLWAKIGDCQGFRNGSSAHILTIRLKSENVFLVKHALVGLA